MNTNAIQLAQTPTSQMASQGIAHAVQDYRGRSALTGIFQKFGQTLPLVDRVPGVLKVSEITPDLINGFLVTGASRICVRFDAKAKGPLPPLRRHFESLASIGSEALSIASVPIWVSGRAWVAQDGVIVLLVRSFGINLREGGAL